MSNASPLVGLALTIGLPLFIRHFSSFSSLSLRPRIQHRLASLKTSPTECLLLTLVIAAVLHASYKLLPWTSSYRLAQDVFRHTSLPIGINSATLRGRLASKTIQDLGLDGLQSFSSTSEAGPLGAAIANEGDVVDRLLRRLSSMNGRQLYLLLGANAVLDCHYCKQPLDLQYFAIPPILLTYAVQFLGLGLLTASPAVLTALDDLLAPIWPFERTPVAASAHKRWSSANCKTIAASVLLTALIAELALITDTFGWSENQNSWWNHWHHNAYLAKNILFAILPVAVYAYPSPPSPTASHAARIQSSILQIGANIQNTTTNLSILDAGRQALWQDAEMRNKVATWYDDNQQQLQNDQRLIQQARHAGILPDSATAKIRHTVQQRISAVLHHPDGSAE